MTLSNNQIKLINSLHSKKGRIDNNLFLVEGEKGIRELVDSSLQIEFIVLNNKEFNSKLNCGETPNSLVLSISSMIPVIIILYNRPKHTQKLLQSITYAKNSSKYMFYIFCDGPSNKEDVRKIKKIDINKEQMSLQKTLLYYTVVVAIGSLLFWVIPWFALLLFILVSGYHFGEQQWENLEKSNLFKIFEFAYPNLKTALASL